MTLRLQTISAAVKAIDGSSRRVSAIISTENPDRSGDIVRSRGCDFANFMASGAGPVLWNHDQDQVIARAISVDVEATRVTSVAEFPPSSISSKADKVYGLIKSNLVNSASIGFIPKKMKPAEKQRGLDISEWELLEWSFVIVPANADAAITLRSLHAVAPLRTEEVLMKSSEARRVSVIISTDTPNSHGNIVLSRSCDFKNFLAYGSGPVLLNHDVNQIIARAISLSVEESRVTAVAEFPPPGVFAKSDEVYDLIHQNFVNSASIGYKYLKKRPDEGRPDLNVVESWELLEFSFVRGVPANAEASIISKGPASDLKSRHQLNINPRAKNTDLYRRLRLQELRSSAFIQGLTTLEWCEYAAKISGARHARPS